MNIDSVKSRESLAKVRTLKKLPLPGNRSHFVSAQFPLLWHNPAAAAAIEEVGLCA